MTAAQTSHETRSRARRDGIRFARRLRGYDTALVDEAVAGLEQRAQELETQAVELREALLEAQHGTSEARHDLARAKAELRYWNDRASYVDSEVARARQRATELETAARERADAIEADAQERSLQLIDRVCNEANALLQSAREEAREMFLRFETDVDLSQRRLEQLEVARTEMAGLMHEALTQFEQAMTQLDKVAPARRVVDSMREPVRRATPTFGQSRALEAARRFEAEADVVSAAAMSTPITSSTTLAASVADVDARDEDAPVATAPELTPDSPSLVHRMHAADDEFATLLQP